MRYTVITAMALGGFLGWASAAARAADEETVREHFEQRVQQINRQTAKADALDTALHHISVESGVPEDQVREQHRRNPRMGAAGLLLANVLSAETRKEPDYFIKQRAEGKRWLALARENNVPIENLNRRLDSLEKAIEPAQAGISSRTLPADTDREFDRRTQEIDRMTAKPAVLNAALHHISVETGVAEDQVRQQHQQNPNLTASGVLLANVMSAETRKDSDYFIKQRTAGKGWLTIARDNNVPIENLHKRLDNLEKAIGPAQEAETTDAPSNQFKNR